MRRRLLGVLFLSQLHTHTHVLKALAGLSLFVYLFVGLFACCSLWFDCLTFSSSCSFSCSLVSLLFSLLLFIWQLCALIAVVVAPLIAQSESRHYSGAVTVAVTVTVSGAVTVTYFSHRTHSCCSFAFFRGDRCSLFHSQIEKELFVCCKRRTKPRFDAPCASCLVASRLATAE